MQKPVSPIAGFDLSSLLDAMPFYVLLIDSDHKILMANKATKNDLDLDQEKILGEYCPKVIHGLDVPYPGCPLEEALEKGHSIEREFFNHETNRWINSAIYWTGIKTKDDKEIFVHLIIDITKRKDAEEEILRNYDIQSVINAILRLSLKNIPLEALLGKVLDLILSIPRLSIENKGAIFLVEDEPGTLIMKVQRGLPLNLQKECSQLDFGRCICGRAALTRELQFTARVDDQHEIRYRGMTSHGHYCVPIVSGDKTLGVINLYLEKGHEEDLREKEFLTIIANTLAGVIDRKQIDMALQKKESELEIKSHNLEDMNKALTVLLKRRDEDRKELEEKVLFNVKELVVQYIEKLRNSGLDSRQNGLLDVLESNLNSIISPFSRTLSSKYLNLTPLEIQIADLIRQGKTTKEIAGIYNLSPRTIEFHRQNIRKKLDIKNKKANLRSNLLALQ